MLTIWHVLYLVLILWCAFTWSIAVSCDSCGRECASACGTRNFRTCCFNYLKKRSGPSSPGVRLELMMVVPELAQYYPSLKNFIPDTSEQFPYDNHARILGAAPRCLAGRRLPTHGLRYHLIGLGEDAADHAAMGIITSVLMNCFCTNCRPESAYFTT